MKKTKWIGLALSFLTLIAFTGCTDEDPDWKKDDKTCCHYEGTVTYLPEGCVVPLKDLRKGIMDHDGKYYYVANDQTDMFKDAEIGAEVKFGYTAVEPCDGKIEVHTENEDFATIEYECIRLECLEVVSNPASDCPRPASVGYDDYQDMGAESYNLLAHEVKDRTVTMDMFYSGCERDNKIDLIITELPSVGIYPHYVCKIDFVETMCEMAVNRQLCFDLSALPKNANVTLETPKGNHKLLVSK